MCVDMYEVLRDRTRAELRAKRDHVRWLQQNRRKELFLKKMNMLKELNK